MKEEKIGAALIVTTFIFSSLQQGKEQLDTSLPLVPTEQSVSGSGMQTPWNSSETLQIITIILTQGGIYFLFWHREKCWDNEIRGFSCSVNWCVEQERFGILWHWNPKGRQRFGLLFLRFVLCKPKLGKKFKLLHSGLNPCPKCRGRRINLLLIRRMYICRCHQTHI